MVYRKSCKINSKKTAKKNKGSTKHSSKHRQNTTVKLYTGRRSKKSKSQPKAKGRCRIRIQGPPGPQGFRGSTGAAGSQGNEGAIGHQGIAGVTGPVGPQGIQGPQGPQGPQGLQGQPGSISGIFIIPRAQRYFYFAASDIESPIVIQANQFFDDEGNLSSRFTGIGLNSYSNVYINGILQENSLYILTENTLTLIVNGDIIYSRTPIIIEIVQFVAQIIS